MESYMHEEGQSDFDMSDWMMLNFLRFRQKCPLELQQQLLADYTPLYGIASTAIVCLLYAAHPLIQIGGVALGVNLMQRIRTRRLKVDTTEVSLPSHLNFQAHKVTTSRAEQDAVLEARKTSTRQPGSVNRAPGLSFQSDGKSSNIAMDLEFEERLKAVKRYAGRASDWQGTSVLQKSLSVNAAVLSQLSALEQKKIDEIKEYESIDYDALVESDRSTVGLGTKIGIGGAIAVFGLVFALGDFTPTGSEIPTEEATIVNSKLSEDAKQNLQARLGEYEAMLSASPQDSNSLEGAAVTLAELGEFTRAASLLEDLIMKKPNDPDAFRLLGEVKYQLRDYEESAAAYRRSAMVSKTINFDVLRGLTNALLAAKKPDEMKALTIDFRTAREKIVSDIPASAVDQECPCAINHGVPTSGLGVLGMPQGHPAESCNSPRSSSRVRWAATGSPLTLLGRDCLGLLWPVEAVQVLLASRERLIAEMSNDLTITTDGDSSEKESQLVDPIQVELLLGKAYSDWGHVSDAVSIYDQLISNHPDDFRGYLAKGIILKQNDGVGDAERMFIQVRAVLCTREGQGTCGPLFKAVTSIQPHNRVAIQPVQHMIDYLFQSGQSHSE
ncbi:hypothetical protein RHSIM_Rhsim02G0000100 [Rhododendron simsii]|uniref:Uncharacterized protein n=1 Tax=Rhododendron simsii TaxID=118357 RepID=A0A834HC68_RHOSS|nr:hypothetical protein RHSIM_Rhsim02G0000100 [Rhododendron simsii]